MEVAFSPTTFAVNVNAYHDTHSTAEVSTVFGDGQLELDVGGIHSDGSIARYSFWTREILGVDSRDILADAASWLAENDAFVEQLCLDGWELHMDLTMIARDAISLFRIPHELMKEMLRHPRLIFEFSVFPKPNVMP